MAATTNITGVTALFGSTGLVGSNILSTLLAGNYPTLASTVQTISRRAPKDTGAKLQAVVEEDTTQWASQLSSLAPAPTTVFSAVGTTRAAAGGIANQWKIDHDLNVELAKAAKALPAVCTFVFISSAGTRGFIQAPYGRMKNGVEDAIEAAGFDTAIILRPGLIVGDREKPHTGGSLLNGIVHGLGKVFGQGAADAVGQDAVVIARAAVHAAQLAAEGKAPSKFWVVEQRDIVRLGRNEWKE
ncbi:hypothetical protein B0T26DRAFT_653993 [Lasiosphaeria miniovina]|uniref:NAD-dependent epimerase/dehydratase domain-containing protein n=1 Tax=Lasiosphaeria miniovina TaxID=1954250 RepID=A0AA40A5M7_9PEZI|nr:uncharacterized protein B0T26DRAFT_653993 [Lasiosphaeria miniovina]KAK0709727.1 hypothetical protein B0T26DRAFT_653993 [Lasiosphaeria miniovina]